MGRTYSGYAALIVTDLITCKLPQNTMRQSAPPSPSPFIPFLLCTVSSLALPFIWPLCITPPPPLPPTAKYYQQKFCLSIIPCNCNAKTSFKFVFEIIVHLSYFCSNFLSHDCWLTETCCVDVSNTVYMYNLCPPPPHPSCTAPLPERSFTLGSRRALSTAPCGIILLCHFSSF